MHYQRERSPSESLFWPVVWAVGLHVIMFAMLFVSFAFAPDLPPARPVVQATLYKLQSQSQATTQTNQKIAGETKKTTAPIYETEQLEQKKAELAAVESQVLKDALFLDRLRGLRGREILELNAVLVEPLLVGLRGVDALFHLVVGDDAAFLHVHEEHATGLEAAFFLDVFGLDGEDAGF